LLASRIAIKVKRQWLAKYTPPYCYRAVRGIDHWASNG